MAASSFAFFQPKCSTARMYHVRSSLLPHLSKIATFRVQPRYIASKGCYSMAEVMNGSQSSHMERGGLSR